MTKYITEILTEINEEPKKLVAYRDSAALHVQGSIKFDDRLHQYGERFPSSGNYNKGDVVWNTEPRPGSYIGWVCISAGAPGIWLPFGDIKPTL